MSLDTPTTTRKRRVWFLIPALATIPLLIAIWTTPAPKPAASVPHALATSTIDCLSNWYKSPNMTYELTERCGHEKGTRTVKEAERELQTAEAILALTPPIPLPLGTVFPPSPRQVLLPQPDDTKIIRPMVISDVLGYGILNCMVRGKTSKWLLGSVPSSDYTHWWPTYLITRPGNGESDWSCAETAPVLVETNPTLEVFSLAADNYYYTWTSPKPVQAIYITNITSTGLPGLNVDGDNFPGLNYIVYFTTKTGDSGQFDMAKETWTWNAKQP